MTVGTNGGTIKADFEWDEHKRRLTLADRGLDFRDVALLFDGRAVVSYPSERKDELRWVTVGAINGRLIVVVWTPRSDLYRIISMRRARDAEEKVYHSLHSRPAE